HFFNERYGLLHVFLRASIITLDARKFGQRFQLSNALMREDLSRIAKGEMVYTGSEVLVCPVLIALKSRIKSAFIERNSNTARIACLLHVLKVSLGEAPGDIIIAANMGNMR